MLSAGKILANRRCELGLEVAQVAEKLKIQPRFLEALEKGDWKVFDGTAHIHGFLRNYAHFLELDVDQVLAFWRRDYDPTKEVKKASRLPRPLALPRLVLTPALTVTVASVVFVLLFFGYLAFRYQAFAGPPELTIGNPASDLATREKSLEIYGETTPDATITLNGQQIIPNEDGTFSSLVSLNEGLNVLNFVAANKLGRENTVTRQVNVLSKEPVVAGESIDTIEKEASEPATLEETEGE